MAQGIDIIAADLNRFVRGEVIALGVNVNANLRDAPPLGTPIDTGWASANWVPSIGSPHLDATAERPDDISPAQVAAQNALAQQGLNEILTWDFNNGSIFSTNSVPYIRRLNEGWSNKSPAGFVQIAVERTVRDTASRAGARAIRGSRGATIFIGRPGS